MFNRNLTEEDYAYLDKVLENTLEKELLADFKNRLAEYKKAKEVSAKLVEKAQRILEESNKEVEQIMTEADKIVEIAKENLKKSGRIYWAFSQTSSEEDSKEKYSLGN